MPPKLMPSKPIGVCRFSFIAEFLATLIEMRDRERRQSPQFGDENLSKVSGAGFLNPCANAFQALQPMYAAFPQY